MNPALAKKIADAKTGGGGNRIKDGGYLLEVYRLLCSAKFTGTMFIAEFGVVEAAATEEGVMPNQPGTTCSVAWGIDKGGKAGEAALGNTKQLVCALAGLDEESTSQDEYLEVLQALVPDDEKEQPARGMLVRCETYRKEIQTGRSAGKNGTFPKFAHVEQTDDQIAKQRASIDARAKSTK